MSDKGDPYDRVVIRNEDGWRTVAIGSKSLPCGATPFSTGHPVRIERGASGRIGRLIVEAEDYLLDDFAQALGLAPAEAPPVHELEARIKALEERAEKRTELDSLRGR